MLFIAIMGNVFPFNIMGIYQTKNGTIYVLYCFLYIHFNKKLWEANGNSFITEMKFNVQNLLVFVYRNHRFEDVI